MRERREREGKRDRRAAELPARVWKQYNDGISWKEESGLFDTVRRNENFFLGRQWQGVNAPDIDKPVFNVLKRVVNYFIAMLVADDIGLSFSLFNRALDNVSRTAMKVCETQVRQVIEYARIHAQMRGVLRDACVDGDGCLHVYFDPEVDTGRPEERGFLQAERLQNTAVIFGNPQEAEAQRQPFIILEQRLRVEDVKRMMRRYGRLEAEIEGISPDDRRYTGLAEENLAAVRDKVTVLTRYRKNPDTGRVSYCKTTESAVVQPETDTGLRLYPICWMSWEPVQNSYHGQSVITELLPNQMAINKLAAMAQRFLTTAAFPRMFYDAGKLPDGIDNSLRPLATHGSPQDAIWSDRHTVNMSSQVGEYLDKFVSLTRDLMGASDAALGNVNPQNTSAIIATQKATAIPLELVKQGYHQFVEDFVRVCLDQMRVFYGRRTVVIQAEDGSEQEVFWDFSQLESMALQLNVDVGRAAYWDEVTAVTSLSNLMQQKLIDPLTYIENLPESAIPNKKGIEKQLREQVKRQQEQQAMAAQAQQAMAAGGGAAIPPGMTTG